MVMESTNRILALRPCMEEHQEAELPSGPGVFLVFSLWSSRQASSSQVLSAGRGSRGCSDRGRRGGVGGRAGSGQARWGLWVRWVMVRESAAELVRRPFVLRWVGVVSWVFSHSLR